MQEAINTLRPHRRTNSLPGSLADPIVTYDYPTCIEDAINGPRQAFAIYDKGMHITTLDSNSTADVRDADANAESVTPNAQHLSCQAALSGGPTTAVTDSSMTDEDRTSEGTTVVSLDADGNHRSQSDTPVAAGDGTPPPLAVAGECAPYDPAMMKEWLEAFRSCRDRCPAGIFRFFQSLPPAAHSKGHKAHKVGGGGSGGGGASKSVVPDFGSRLGHAQPHHHQTDAGGSSHFSGRAALAALGDLWEDRKDMPIAVNTSVRRRGLFGSAEKKDLHQMVIAVLNKVTSDPAKFREVRNELLRLPIPEASTAQLDDVVAVFFTKAVHEQHFCHSYADLIAALCKVPQGQQIAGDKTLSLEYRLRLSLIRRCQREFAAGMQDQADGGEEETTKERRDFMVGNVRFVCELFLRGIVFESVITIIFVTCCAGSEFASLVYPPKYTPTEAQVDEAIAAVQSAGMRYFRTQQGQELLPALIDNLRYWTVHHSVTRCRFVLMTTVDALQGFRNALEGLAEHQQQRRQQQLEQQHQATDRRTPENAPESSPTSFQSFSPLNASGAFGGGGGGEHHPHPAALVSNTSLTSPLFQAVAVGTPKSSTTVGGKGLPVPRSQRSTSLASGFDSAASPVLLAPASPDSAGAFARASEDPRLHALPPLTQQQPPPPQQQLPPRQPAQRTELSQPVRPETIAKMMADFSSGAATAEATAELLVAHYGDPVPPLAVWFDRCLSVVREEKTRLRSGALLAALLPTVGRAELRGIVFAALRGAVAQGLHEDLKIFRFLAQIVLSDAARAVLDESILEDGIRFLSDHCPAALRAYLAEVGAWYATVVAGPAFVPTEEGDDFGRYRPLLCAYLVLTGGDPDAAGEPGVLEAMLEMVNFPDVRKGNLEVDLYVAVSTGALAAGTAAADALLEKVSAPPRIHSDPTLAAAVLSAVLVAELTNPDSRSFLEDALPLLQHVIDGPNRGDREIALVAEAQEVIRRTGHYPRHSAEARVLMKLRSFHVVSDETIDRAQQYASEKAAAEREAAALSQPPPSIPQTPLAVEARPSSGSPQQAPVSLHNNQQQQQPRPSLPQIVGRPRAESIRSGSDLDGSTTSSRRGGGAGVAVAGGGGAVPVGGVNGSGSVAPAGWRSLTGSVRSGQRTPDASQHGHLQGGGGGGRGSRQPGGGRGQYNYRSRTTSNSGSASVTDSPTMRGAAGASVSASASGSGTYYGVAGARGGKSAKYNYKSSSAYHGSKVTTPDAKKK